MSDLCPVPPLPPFEERTTTDPSETWAHLMATEESRRKIADIQIFLESFALTSTRLTEGPLVEILARTAGGSPMPAAWNLAPAGKEKYRIQTGKIYLDPGDWTNPMKIEGTDKEFPVNGEEWIWLELDVSDPEKPKMEMKWGKKWDWYPDTLKETSAPSSIRKAAFPVWQFRKGDEAKFPSETLVKPKLIGERFLRSEHAIVAWGVHRFATKDKRNDQTYAPILIPLA